MNVYAVWVKQSGFYHVEADSADMAEAIVDSRADGDDVEFELVDEEVTEVNLVQRIAVEDEDPEFALRNYVATEMGDLADSLDDHVTKEDVVRELRALATRVEEGAY